MSYGSRGGKGWYRVIAYSSMGSSWLISIRNKGRYIPPTILSGMLRIEGERSEE